MKLGKRILPIALAGALSLGMLAGCSFGPKTIAS